MTETKTEPSIEEILGSIRRIIAEDDDGSAPAKEAAAAPVTDAAEDEPLELTNKIESAPAVPVTASEPPPMDVSFVDAAPAALEPVAEAPKEEMPVMSNQDDIDSLLSTTTVDATAAVMSQLARHTAITDEGHDGITIESVVRETLKPLLRDWLDKNLPAMVEKMVARELDRLSKRL